MSTIREKITNAADFAELREAGIHCLEVLSGKNWTDFNAHDPGITIMEAVIYAMTEVGIHTSLSDEQLFLSGNPITSPLVPPPFALGCEPVLASDWQKAIADLIGVSRCWLAENRQISPPVYVDTLSKILNLNGGSVLQQKGIFDLFVELSSTELPSPNDFSDLELNGNIIRTLGPASFVQLDGSTERFFVEFAFPFWESYPADWHNDNVVINLVTIPGGITFNQNNNVFTALIKVDYNGANSFQGGVVIRFTPFYTQNTPIATLSAFTQSILTDISSNGILKRLNKKIANIYLILAKVQDVLEQKRIFATYFNPPKASRLQEIAIQADIMLPHVVDFELLVSSIFVQIERLLSPIPDSFSEEELIEKKYSLDQIYEGPLLSNGFLLDEQMIPQPENQILYASDFIHAILERSLIADSNKIISFSLSCFINNYLVTGPSTDCLKLSNSLVYRPRLSVVKSKIRLFRDGSSEEIKYDKGKVLNFFQENTIKSIKRIELNHKEHFSVKEDGIPGSKGLFYSIQHDFPAIYGIGKGNLPFPGTPIRIAQSRQLKAYLLIFEQYIANSIRQVENIPHITSLDLQLSAMQPVGELYEVPDVDVLLEGFLTSGTSWTSFINNPNNLYRETIGDAVESSGQFFTRRNRYLDHLLARFGEDLSDYTAIMLSKGYFDIVPVASALKPVPLMLAKGFYDAAHVAIPDPALKATAWKVLQDKLFYLNNIGKIEGARGIGSNFIQFIRIIEVSPAQWRWYVFDPLNNQDLAVSNVVLTNALACFDDLMNAITYLQKNRHFKINGIAPNLKVSVLKNPPAGSTIIANLLSSLQTGIFTTIEDATQVISRTIELVGLIWDTPNISGLERKIGGLLGWESNLRRDLVKLTISKFFSIESNGVNFAFSIMMDNGSPWPLISPYSHPNNNAAEAAAQKAVIAGIAPSNYAVSVVGNITVITLSDLSGILATIEIPQTANIDIHEFIGKWAIFLYKKFASQEGFYLVEHQLVLPKTKNALLLSQHKFVADTNPYQYQISIVIPDGTDSGLTTNLIQNRLQDPDFKVLMEKRIQSECMAHVFPYIIYPSTVQFASFQRLFNRWHVWKRLSAASAIELESEQNNFVTWLNSSNPTLPVYNN